MRSIWNLARCSLIVATAAAGLSAAPAQAKSYQTRISAQVPTNCSAGISGSFSRLSADSFSLGSVEQYCNLRFQLSLTHSTPEATAQLSFGGSAVSLGQDTTVLKPLANPTANAADQVVLAGVNEAQAQQFGSSLTVTISPIAF